MKLSTESKPAAFFHPKQHVVDVQHVVALEAEVARLKDRLRVTCQALVNAAGSDGPMNAEDAADRIVKAYDESRAEVARLREALAEREWIDGHGCVTGDCPHGSQRECIDTLIAFVQELANDARTALAPAAQKDLS